MRSWLDEALFFVRSVSFILDPSFVLKSFSLEIRVKGIVSSKHFRIRRGFFVKIYRFVDLFYYILCAWNYGIYHIALSGGYLQLIYNIFYK